MVTIMGSKSASCGLYADDIKITEDPSSVPIPTASQDNSCQEIQCRAINAKQIISNAKQVIQLSTDSLNSDQINKQQQRKIRKGVKQINKVLPDWETFILKPYSEYSYREAEKEIVRSLEIQTSKQIELLPASVIDPYLEAIRKKEEAERIRLANEKREKEEAEKIRLANEKREKEERLKQELEKKENDLPRKSEQISKSSEETKIYQEKLTCIWALKSDNNILFSPFNHSDCFLNIIGAPEKYWSFFNFILLLFFIMIFVKVFITKHLSEDQVYFLLVLLYPVFIIYIAVMLF